MILVRACQPAVVFSLSRLLHYQTEELVLIYKHGKKCFVIDLLSPTNLICTCFMAITPSAIYLPYAFINKEDALINYGLEGLCSTFCFLGTLAPQRLNPYVAKSG